MSKTYIPARLRQEVATDAQFRCGYCHTTQHISGQLLVIDHLIPEACGGLTVRENLWLACRLCNEFKGTRTEAIDPLTNDSVPLFNPRTQSWEVHFTWSEDGTEIIGLTAIGRATVEALKMNNDVIVAARSLWVQAGLHPPVD
ncbi:MAG: HNH endonuclease [Anaerolineae bacterium]|nr:HNH endonuclease [Anaerolineae bacterium]